MNWHFFKKLSSKQRKIIIIAGSVLVIACITLYLFIPVIAKQAIHKKIAKVEQWCGQEIFILHLKVLPSK